MAFPWGISVDDLAAESGWDGELPANDFQDVFADLGGGGGGGGGGVGGGRFGGVPAAAHEADGVTDMDDGRTAASPGGFFGPIDGDSIPDIDLESDGDADEVLGDYGAEIAAHDLLSDDSDDIGNDDGADSDEYGRRENMYYSGRRPNAGKGQGNGRSDHAGDVADMDDGGGGGGSSSRQPKAYTFDDIFLDPEADDRDAAWVEDNHLSHLYDPQAGANGGGTGAGGERRGSTSGEAGGAASGSGRKRQAKPGSNTVLSCPSCLTPVCYDCQRHSRYVTQYRAMFVSGCHVVANEVLSFEASERRGKKKGNNGQRRYTAQGSGGRFYMYNSAADAGTATEFFWPVRCDVCDTELGVYDQEEIYHFFNVAPSF